MSKSDANSSSPSPAAAIGDDDNYSLTPQNCSNELDVHVEDAEHVQYQKHFSEPHGAYKRHIRRAAATGDWIKASSYDTTHPNWVSTPLNANGDTALHIAVSLEQTTFVKKLVERMSMQDMEIVNEDGKTAFCMAAISGNVEIATILLNKNPGLAWIRGGHNDMLPIQLAISTAQPVMANFLFRKTQKDMHINISFQHIVKLFFLALTYKIYSYDKDAPGYHDILCSLLKNMEEEEFLDSEGTSKAMFDAAKSGNIIILDFILKYNPDLLMKMNPEGQSLLHIAILYRQVTVFRLILSMGAYKNAIKLGVDSEGNNVLHLAGMLPADKKFASPINHNLICNEEKLFEEVKRIVPPAFKIMRNKEGLTPKELFLREHKDLSEKAATDLNEMANTFLLVATLIVTLGITGALTIRTNTIVKGTHLLSENTWYIIFLLSVAVGIAFSAVSMLFFTSAILRSVLKQKGVGHVKTRLTRVFWGCWLLFIGIGVMVTFSTTSGAVLVYSFFPDWVLYTIAALGGIGVVLYFLIYDGFVSALFDSMYGGFVNALFDSVCGGFAVALHLRLNRCMHYSSERLSLTTQQV